MPEEASLPYIDWLNDADVCHGNDRHRWPHGLTQARDFIGAAAGDRNNLVLAIELLNGEEHIGNIALQNIDPIHCSAKLSILIGSKTSWGKNYGLEAGRLMVRYGRCHRSCKFGIKLLAV